MCSRHGGAVGDTNLLFNVITSRKLIGTHSVGFVRLYALAQDPTTWGASDQGVFGHLPILTHISMNCRHRLKKSLDFVRVRDAGRSWVHQLVVLAALSNDCGVSRFGFITSKRLGKAKQGKTLAARGGASEPLPHSSWLGLCLYCPCSVA